jgi:hypothetical protein
MNEKSEEVTNSKEFDLAGFIRDWSALFLVMGVFAALAIYILQTTGNSASEASIIIKTGVVASFVLSLLMMFLIYSKMKDRLGSWNELYLAHKQLQNIDLIIFTVFTTLLIFSIARILTLHESVIFVLSLTATVWLSFALFLGTLFAIGKVTPKTTAWRISISLLISIIVLIGSYYLRNELASQFTLTTIDELSMSNPIPIVIDIILVMLATIQSIAAFAILVTLFSIPIIYTDKIRSISPYNQSN